MRVLIQRVSTASVTVPEENFKAEISPGLLIFLGITHEDKEEDAIYLADKCTNLRVFEDEKSRMNLSVADINGKLLIVSQFTLYADASRGNRPNFTSAAKPETAIPLYKKVISRLKFNLGDENVRSGSFGATMSIDIRNEGPVTIIIDSKK